EVVGGVQFVVAQELEKRAVQIIAARLADEADHPAALTVLGREQIAIDLELLYRIHGEQDCRRVEPGAACLDAIDQKAVGIPAATRDVYSEIVATGLISDGGASRVVGRSHSRGDGGKLHEVAAV